MSDPVPCPSCGTPNPPEQRFCGSCGTSLQRPCPVCGTPNPLGYAFCGTCGSALEPPEPTRPAEDAREERRLATVLFADLSGFTALSEKLDPEDVKALAHELAERMGQEVRTFGGTVVSVMGDAIMAVFGAPVTHEDDAERAVRAALAMRDSIQAETGPGLPLQLHIGLNTGEVMAGLIGPEERREYTVMGDVTNTAARLQSAAPPGTILVGRDTYLATAHVIDYEQVEPVAAKGKEETVPAWRVLAARGKPAERAPSGTPLVGRKAEVDLLERLWRQVVEENRPRLVTLIGPPGIGKSRLIRELTSPVEREGRLIKGRCLPYGETTGYDAFSQQVEQAAGILDSDPVPLARMKLNGLVRQVVPEEDAEQVAEHLQIVLGLSTKGAPDKQLLFFSVRRVVEGLAQARPTALAFEDIHWAQPALLELLESLAGRVREVPLLLLTAARPELLDAHPTWGGGLAAYTAISVQPLNEGESRELAISLMTSHGPEESLEPLIQTGGGNPLFLEELAASVEERTAGVASSLPTTVQAIIAARLDALPAEERRVLREASIVGRYFWRGALLALDGEAAALDRSLDSLEARDLIRRQRQTRLAGDPEFLFKHILTQEVAYQALPKAARRRGHAAVARYLEEAMGERARDSASLIAYHWKESGENAKAARYLMTAAEVASRAWAKQEAIGLYTEAIGLLGEEERVLRPTAQLALAITRIDAGDFTEGLQELDAVIPELDGRERALAMLDRARGWYWLADAEQTHRHADEAAAAAREIEDAELEARALAVLGEAAGMDGDTQRSNELSTQALSLWPVEKRDGAYAHSLGQAALGHYWRGDHQRALELGRQAYELGLKASSLAGVINGAAHVALALIGLSRHEEGIDWLARAVEFGREMEPIPRFSARALNMWGGALREIGDLGRARSLNEEALEYGTRAGFLGAEVSARIDLLFVDLEEGEVGRAEASLPELLQAAERSKGWHQWLWTVRVLAARAEAALLAGKPEDAADAAHETLEHAVRPGRLKYACLARTVLGRALLQLRRPDESASQFRLAVEDAERVGHAPTLWPALAGLAEALGALGDDSAEEKARLRARQAIQEFAAGLTTDHRQTLLSNPALAPVLGM
jgi:class 3 adenylate cyclase